MKRTIGIFLVALAALSVIVAAWRVWPRSSTYYTDAESIREPLATTVPRDILWQPPLSLPPVINSTSDDYEPRMSPDGLTLYFVRGKAGRNADIFVAVRTPQGWTDPVALVGVNSDADDLGPEPSADGDSIYFYSNRDGGLGGYDLWTSRRSATGWHDPINLGPAINTEYNDYGPAISPDGSTLYFASNRPSAADDRQPDPNAWSATLREDLFHRTYDLYTARLTDAGWQRAEPLSALNTPSNEGSPSVSPFGDFLYFSSDRASGEGGFDLYRARRLRGQHLSTMSLGASVNTSANELDPGLSLGGYRLDFSSDRAIAGAAAGAPREYNIYQTTSREVFPETEEIARASIDWAGLWRAIGPNLLWALLALALLLLMLWLMGGLREKRLSLMAKCLLASLAAHLLLMLLFNAMEVASSIADELGKGRRGPIRVALAPSSAGTAIAAQLRAGVSENAPLEPIELPASMLRADAERAPLVETRTLDAPIPSSSIAHAELPAPQVTLQDATPAARATPIVDRTPDLPTIERSIELAALESAAKVAQTEEAQPAPKASVEVGRAAPTATSTTARSAADLAPIPAHRALPSGSVAEVRPSDIAVERSPSLHSTVAPPLRLTAATPDFAPLESARPKPIQEDVKVAVPSPIGREARPQSPTTPAPTREGNREIAIARSKVELNANSLATPATASDAPPTNSNQLMPALGASASIPTNISRATTTSFSQPTDAALRADHAEASSAPPPASATPAPRALLSDASPAAPRSRSENFLPPPRSAPPPSTQSFATPTAVADANTIPAAPRSQPLATPALPPHQPATNATAIALPAGEAPTKSAEFVTQAIPKLEPAPPAARPEFASHPALSNQHRSAPVALPDSPRANKPTASLASFDPRFKDVVPPPIPKSNARPIDLVPQAPPPALSLSIPLEQLPEEEPLPQQQPVESAVVPPDQVLGVIRGKVTDAMSGRPLEKAIVRLNLPDQSSVVASTAPDGSYVLYSPDVPENFALSASVDGFVPKSINVERAKLDGRTVVKNFKLEPVSNAVLVTEAVPDVHHLGDNKFDGTINSQFQKQSEGDQFTIRFKLNDAQLQSTFSRAEVRLMAKGVQRNHRIVINDTTLARRLNKAPEDGSFGEFRAPFDPTILVPGVNTLQIIAAPSPDDIDDFEFVNVQVRLAP